MQNAMRRALGVGGAAAVALAASLALAGVADAHTPTFSTGCLDNGQAVLNVDLKYYTTPKTSSDHNTITITYTPEGGKAQSVLAATDFASNYPSNANNKQFFVDGTTAGEFDIVITAWDDPHGDHSVAKVGDNSNAWDGTFIRKTTACPQHGGGTPTPPPPSSQPPSSQPPSTQPPTSTPSSSSTPTTSAAAVAPVSTKTPPGGGLAYTGVSTELPLIIAGVLIVLGGGALITMRIMKRRRAES